jgi:hypothetical protein
MDQRNLKSSTEFGNNVSNTKALALSPSDTKNLEVIVRF